ncbi:MAG: hypothetical protein M0P39_16410 [Rhodocyclaceae bacterium]|nr:hypothetical protein [Rhodocyclaceae bacterium]
MIRAKDLDYHNKQTTDPTYAETFFLIFSVPEESISGNAYVLVRPNVGAILSSIYVHKGICQNAWQADYADAPMHLKAPEKLSSFTLANGFGLSGSNEARDYRFQYQGREGLCTFDLNFKGIMEPFDALDPDQNPMLDKFASTEEAMGAGDGWAQGHYDTIGHITGELSLYGKKYTVDCVDGLDRSWGPRMEWNASPVSWMHMTFGPDLAFHLVMTLDVRKEKTSYTTFRFGYAAVNGEVTGIVAAEVIGENAGMLGVSRIVRIRDAKGREWEMHGAAIAAAPWHSAYGSFISFQTLYRWTMGDRKGHSSVTDVVGLTTLGKRLSRLGSEA